MESSGIGGKFRDALGNGDSWSTVTDSSDRDRKPRFAPFPGPSTSLLRYRNFVFASRRASGGAVPIASWDQIFCESSGSFGSDPIPMLSNHLQNGIETARLVWSRLPSSEDGATAETNGIETARLVWSRLPSSEDGATAEIELPSQSRGGAGAESLDYEVIENYAYREEQVPYPLGFSLLWK
ncbi:hypothetical protein B296_00001885 [Ensete ventricosum]|uniref:Uncharacterized protein n=1 Tax=Ensete ventricosum TaxID=4639 RepID=A0A427AZK6_ENSVE|nr:hypothetical protein B296_00001885 [Ensete ventricosum]